ncbi:MAG: 16S rRNA (adenine(1518)-N(6)/adenine(1519)-N(6))-dimethyltransferase RsmA [Bacilli bacterium]|nr:16S rRNA (adenine(1518)-N(6)/adenine(1519)-N(6))-dimethyltransferase RsmA [Bacilli bacterium]
MIVDETKKILNEYSKRAKKGFGQNFLVNKSIIEGIIKEAKISRDDYVIEIGPGLGSLTEYLCINACKVLCYEIDEDMVDILNNTLKAYDNKKIILGDFLKQNVKKDIEEYFGENVKVKVVANLPYYITTPIMFRLLEIDNVCEEIFMVQKEMADRFTGEVSTKDYNALSVFVKYYTDTKKAIFVSRGNFYPSPNVDSVVIHSIINKKQFDIKNEQAFLNFVKYSFNQRRKTFVNNISNQYKISKSNLEDILKNNNYNPSLRSETLDLNDFVKIYKLIFENGD